MPDYISNRLTITCKEGELKDKIRKMIFSYNENNEPILTMTKLLPFLIRKYTDTTYRRKTLPPSFTSR